MNKVRSTLLFLFVATCFWSCTDSKPKEASEANPQQEGPNIGGLGMPRGLISKTNEATPGYVFFSPLISGTTYLVNTDGKVVHTWESQYGPSGWVYLKDNGNLVRGGRDPYAPVFGGGGQGGILQEFTWGGELVWEFRFANAQHLSHHDVAIMPNGNFLVIAWEAKTPEEALQAGRKPELIPKAGLWPDKIVELKPIGKNDAQLIWEWHIWDHLVQDFDKTKKNYGIPAEHPERIDLNLGGPLPPPITEEELAERRAKNNATTNTTPENRGSDMYHTNAIDYYAELDQIVLSIPALDEIIIIDHSTTTKEAAGRTGGRWGKGGDILYRWGNPKNYSRGDTTHQKLAGQHDARWIPKGYPGEGNILVFNNSVPNSKKPYSSVLEITAPLTGKGYEIGDSKRYGPESASWSYIASDTVSVFAPFISGAHRMANGNTFITEGPKGRYFEVTPQGKVVWDYWTPCAGDVTMPDGTFPQPISSFVYATFRATHIPMDHPAVKGKTLMPLNPQPAVYVEEEKKK